MSIYVNFKNLSMFTKSFTITKKIGSLKNIIHPIKLLSEEGPSKLRFPTFWKSTKIANLANFALFINSCGFRWQLWLFPMTWGLHSLLKILSFSIKRISGPPMKMYVYFSENLLTMPFKFATKFWNCLKPEEKNDF